MQAEFCLRAGFLCLRRIAGFFKVPFGPHPSPDDPISVSREEWQAVVDELEREGVPIKPDRDQACLGRSNASSAGIPLRRSLIDRPRALVCGLTLRGSGPSVALLHSSTGGVGRANSGLAWTMTEDGLVGAGCYFATFHVPQASTLVSVGFYETEGVAAPLDLSIFRVNLATGAKSAPPTPVVDTDRTRQTWTLALPKTWSPVNNAAFEYMLQVCQDVDGVFHGARVKYTFTSAGD